MKLQELKNDELKNVNGGLLGLGDDNSMLSGILEGYVGITQKDEDGDEESTMLNFGLGGLFNSKRD